MDSFKRNIILLATFSIVISNMITPANADYDLCTQELRSENLNVETEFDLEYIVRMQKPIDNFTKPHSKVYHKIINYYQAFMCPLVFCLWIDTNNVELYSKISMAYNLDLNKVWINSIQELNTYSNIDKCLNELLNSNYNSNMVYPYLNAYNRTHKFYSEMPPTLFCPWIIMDANLDHSQIIWNVDNADSLEIWRRVVQGIIVCTDNIGMCSNLYYLLCFADLKKDGFNIDLEEENTDNSENLNHAKISKVKLSTPHGKVYQELLNTHKINKIPKMFCSNLYTGGDSPRFWNNIRYSLVYHTCVDDLKYDGLNIHNDINWHTNMKKLNKLRIRRLKTWISKEYAKTIFDSDISEDDKNTKKFCKNFGLKYVSLL